MACDPPTTARRVAPKARKKRLPKARKKRLLGYVR